MRGFLGLGSNVGDRLSNLQAARTRLQKHGLAVCASSAAYQTEPQGEVTDQPDFANACVTIDTLLGPEELLDVCKQVESELGRRSSIRHGPRPIDVDLLLLGPLRYRSTRLTLPHRDLVCRRFVLVPLLELDPDASLPDGTRLDSKLAQTADQRVELIGPW